MTKNHFAAVHMALFPRNIHPGGMIEKLFKELDKQLDKDGIIVHAGKLVDATIVEVPVQRNSRDENKDIKKGKVPQEWKDNENKLRQKEQTHSGLHITEQIILATRIM